MASTSTVKRTKKNTLDKLEISQQKEKDRDNPLIAQALSYMRLRAKARKPETMVPRVGRHAANYLPTIKPPYNNLSMDRFEDCFRSDKLVQNGIIKRVELVVGQHGKVVLDTTEEYDTQDERTAALEKVNNNTKYQDAKKQIEKLHLKPSINFHNNLKAAEIQKRVYGRAAIEIVGSPAEVELGTTGTSMPEALHVLNSKRLGQVEINPLTWEFIGVRYLDLQKGPSGMDDLLESDELIYFANKDYHVSPGSLYYGLSELEGIVDGSDSKRIAKQEDIKEIMKTNWAPFLMMMFRNPNITDAQIQRVVDQISPGLPFAHKHDIEAQVFDLKGDLKQISEAIDFLNRESLRELGIPAFVGGYEQIANYANSQQVLLAFKEIELEADRTAIKDIIQPQWLNKLFYQLLGIDPEAGDEPEAKLSYEFGDITFETKLDKVNADLLLFDRGLISGEKVLKTADYEDELEEYKLRQEEKERQKEMMLQKFRSRQLAGQEPGQEPGAEEDQTQGGEQPAKEKGRGAQPSQLQKRQRQPAEKQVSTTPRKR
jgi:hypothetical protein